jgi:hypothetical protein
LVSCFFNYHSILYYIPLIYSVLVFISIFSVSIQNYIQFSATFMYANAEMYKFKEFASVFSITCET